ncbi:MAG: thermonuclease family protein [Candidatus Taylorbacteria bacterium]|nr:thermonuclease family protein [Candidatus Taylorbacteria bacterium]
MFISKKILYAAGGAAILLAGIFIGSAFSGGKLNLLPAQTAAVESAKTAASVSVFEQHSNILENVGMLNNGSTKNGVAVSADGLVRVVRAVDGDTIELEGGERVRYIGVDTPETVDPRKPVQCFGVAASKKNRELVEGKTVRLEKDITDRDKYNRLLRYVWLGDVLVNQELVAQGFAKSYSYPPDVKYQSQFVAAEKQARESKLGLWAACVSAAAPATAVMPSAAQASASNPSCAVKGNISASGEKIYHLQGCGSYAKTTIDESRGERWFCSEQEAQTAGWRRALNCP